MGERIIKPTEKHQAFRNDLIVLLNKHAGDLDAKEMLAISAHLVGQIIAMQDQRTITRSIALEIVTRNIEAGNMQAMAAINGEPAGSA